MALLSRAVTRTCLRPARSQKRSMQQKCRSGTRRYSSSAHGPDDQPHWNPQPTSQETENNVQAMIGTASFSLYNDLLLNHRVSLRRVLPIFGRDLVPATSFRRSPGWNIWILRLDLRRHRLRWLREVMCLRWSTNGRMGLGLFRWPVIRLIEHSNTNLSILELRYHCRCRLGNWLTIFSRRRLGLLSDRVGLQLSSIRLVHVPSNDRTGIHREQGLTCPRTRHTCEASASSRANDHSGRCSAMTVSNSSSPRSS